jgi:Ca2+-binding EF-hand superfamily protein
MWPLGHILQPRRNRDGAFKKALQAIVGGTAAPTFVRAIYVIFIEVIFIESQEVNMSIQERSILTTLAIMLIGTAPAWSQSLLKTLDPDADGTVDLAEAKSATSKLVDKLDRDHDGTLDKRELRGRLNAKDFAAADPDDDGTLDKDEFLVLVEKRFKAADPDNDGTIDAKELKSAAGRSLARLLK